MPIPRLANEEFLRRAKQAHGSKYSYPDLSYEKCSDKIEIICPTHGSFKQAVSNHMGGQGCRGCQTAAQRYTFERFLEEATALYGSTYEYDSASFSKLGAKTRLKCSLHGWQEVQAFGHLRRGRICPVCSKKKMGEQKSASQTMTFEEFERRARALFGERYLYHRDTFVRGNAPTTITCRVHGDFQKNACFHLTGSGCQVCGAKTGARKSAKKNTITFEEFVRRADKLFEGRYNYDRSTYTSISKFTTVTCKEHGTFTVQAVEHTKGIGCPRCSFARSRPERKIRALLEEVGVTFQEQWIPPTMRKDTGKGLRYDFYLPTEKIIIEYDGRHHFEPAFGSTPERAAEVLARTQEHDRIKNEWAAAHGLKLYRLRDERKLAQELALVLPAMARGERPIDC